MTLKFQTLLRMCLSFLSILLFTLVTLTNFIWLCSIVNGMHFSVLTMQDVFWFYDDLCVTSLQSLDLLLRDINQHR